MNNVFGSGSGDILILGDFPRPEDVAAGEPFSSPHGKLLRRIVASENITARFENVVQQLVTKSELWHNPSVPSKLQTDAIKDLHKRIDLLKPKVIVTLGQLAYRALVPDGRLKTAFCHVHDNPTQRAIIIPAHHPAELFGEETNLYWLRVAIMKAAKYLSGYRDPGAVYVTNNDEEHLDFILARLQRGEIKSCSLDIETPKLDKFKDPLAIDWSTVLRSIGFLFNEEFKAYAFSLEDMRHQGRAKLAQIIKKLFEDPTIELIGQNFIFDATIIHKIYGFPLRGPVYDTMHAANLLNPDLPKGLDDLARIYLFTAPWKGSWNTTGERLRTYNAQDVLFTKFVQLGQINDMREIGQLTFFNTYIKPLFQPAYYISAHGMPFDTRLQAQFREDAQKVVEAVKAEIQILAEGYISPGEKKKPKRDPANDTAVKIENLNLGDKPEKLSRTALNNALLATGVVPKPRLKDYYIAKKKDTIHGHTIGVLYKKAMVTEIELYKRDLNPAAPQQVEAVFKNMKVRLPKTKKPKKGWEESTDKKAMTMIALRKDEKKIARDLATAILKFRLANKFLTSYCNALIDNNRWYCTYNIAGTKSGRSSTKKTSWGIGGNNQNIPRGGFENLKFRKCFTAEPGRQLMQVDLRTAEALVVAWLAEDDALAGLLNDGTDLHAWTASKIFDLSYEEIVNNKDHEPYKTKRYLGKKSNHSFNYGFGARAYAEACLVDAALQISTAEAEVIRSQYHATYPKIQGVFWQYVREEIDKGRVLISPHGRRRPFLKPLRKKNYQGIYVPNESLYREGYSFIPQATVVDTTNMAWIKLAAHQRKDYFDIIQQGHDSLILNVVEDRIEELAKLVSSVYNSLTFKIHGVERLIPHDITVGPSWGEQQDI